MPPVREVGARRRRRIGHDCSELPPTPIMEGPTKKHVRINFLGEICIFAALLHKPLRRVGRGWVQHYCNLWILQFALNPALEHQKEERMSLESCTL